jgi:hypothetical protein
LRNRHRLAHHGANLLGLASAVLRRKLLWIPAVVIALYAMLGFFVLPRVLRTEVPEKLSAALKRPTTVGEIAFNPFTFELDLHDLAVKDLISFKLLRVNLSSTALLHRHLVFDAIELHDPRVELAIDKNGQLSIHDLLAPSPDAKKSDPIAVTVSRFAIIDGALVFHDFSRPEPFTAKLEPLEIELDDFATAGNTESHYAFQAKMGQGELDYDGELTTNPLTSSGKLSLKGVSLKWLEPYLEGALPLDVLHGFGAVSGHYTYDGKDLALDNCALEIDALKLGVDKKTMLELNRFVALAPKIDVASRTVHVSKIELKKGSIDATREEVTSLTQPPKPEAQPKHAAAPPKPSRRKPAVTHNAASPPWSVRVDAVAFENWNFSWADDTLEFPSHVAINELNLDVHHAKWPDPGPLDVALAMRWQDAGHIKVKGKVHPEPLALDLNVDLDAVSLIALDGYMWEVGFNGTLEHALLTSAFDMHFADSGKDLALKGDIALDNVALLDGNDRELVDAKRIKLTGVDYGATAINVGTVLLSGGRLKIARDEKGSVNLSRLKRDTGGDKGGGKAPTISVNEVVLEDTSADWYDQDTRPPFASQTSHLNGRFTNVTVPVTRPIGVQLSGRIDQAPTTVSGMVLPVPDALEADLKFTIEGYDLPHASAYAVKYVAQPISSGKLVIGLDAKIAQQKLDATTHLVIDGLEFGESISPRGPDAKSLPLGLAVAVLSDQDGRIELTLPVTGDMSSPDFKWGTVLWPVLLNLMEKIGTSPLALVKDLFQGAHEPEELRALSFPPGASIAEDKEAAKLDSIAKLLTARPKLKLHLMPGVDPVADRQALARTQLKRSLSAQGGGSDLSQSEYEKAVHAAWANKAPDAGSRSFAEKEAELLKGQRVSDEDLTALKSSRAEWCQSTLQDRGVPMTRVFVKEPPGEKARSAHVHMEVK